MYPEILTVSLGERSYDILIGPGLVAQAGEEIRRRLGARRTMIVADRNAATHYLAPLMASLQAAGLPVAEPALVPPGEASKSFAQWNELCETLLAMRPDRSTLLIALGGGVVGDLTGFAAASLLRGLDFVQMPTTLLSQVDSSVGGKTGINAKAGKNLIGAFHQPRLVLADISTLNTLPRRELLSGYAEVVKHGLIVDKPLFEHLETGNRSFLDGDVDERMYAVRRSCGIKAAIVARDEHETGDRALLNLGHTFGHALEFLTGYGGKLTHGEGVAIGCIMAFGLSVRLGLCPQADLDRVRTHFTAAGLPVTVDPAWDIGVEAMISAMRGDKKNTHDRIRFILTRGIGEAFRSDGVDEPELVQFLETALR